jgi:hypothetical protein
MQQWEPGVYLCAAQPMNRYVAWVHPVDPVSPLSSLLPPTSLHGAQGELTEIGAVASHGVPLLPPVQGPVLVGHAAVEPQAAVHPHRGWR